MKKLLVTLLVAATTVNFVACSSGDKAKENGTVNKGVSSSDEKVTLSVQVEEGWVPYYEQVRETVLKDYPNASIEFITTGAFDHLDVLDQTDATNDDVADVFALPADRLYGLAKNQVLAAMPADKMAEEVGGFADFNNGLGGNFKIDDEYLAFPYNIETLIGFVNVENAKIAGVDYAKPIEVTELGANQLLTTVHDAWFGVAFANSAGFELLNHDGSDKLYSDGTKEWAELTDEQKKLFEGLYNYWSLYKDTSLWDKEAAGGYIDEQFKTGGSDAVKIDGPWATTSVSELVGSAENLEIIPLGFVLINC